MFKFELLAIVNVCFLALGIKCQDTSFCDTNSFPADPLNLPLPFFNNSLQYQFSLERNSLDAKLTEEIVEYFDGLDNIGISINTLAGIKTYNYGYFKLNELLLIENDMCKVFKLNESYGLSPFYVVNDANGNEHIASLSSLILNSPGAKFVYIGSKNTIRGIPVNEWKGCVYNPNQKITYKVTTSYSDPNKWSSAGQSGNFPSVPIQIIIESKSQDGKVNTDVTSITQFRPFLTLEEEDYMTPNGVYCAGRKNLKELPVMPNSFSFFVQTVQPIPNSQNQLGTISNDFEHYDGDNKLNLFTYNDRNSNEYQIHDFNTGLNYTINRKSGSCEIKALTNNMASGDIDENGNFKNVSSFFNFDGIPYQFVGLKRVDGVNADVWIGPANYSGNLVYFEWYFLSDFWNRTDIVDKSIKIPIQLKVYIPQIQNKKDIIYYHFYAYQKTDFNPNLFDLSACDSLISQTGLYFNLPVSYTPTIRKYKAHFEAALSKKIQQVAQVSILRIAKIKIEYNNNSVDVFFNLYEKSSFYGNVPTPSEVLSRDAIQNLKNSFTSGNFNIMVLLDNNQYTEIKPNPDSFSVANNDDSGQDFDFCDINKIVEDPAKLAVPSGLSQAQAIIEKNSVALTEEIIEYYDARNDIGIAITTLDGVKAYTYSYYKTDELLLVKDKTCNVYKLSQAYGLSPFSVLYVNGTEVIASPLAFINKPGSKLIYTGSNQIVRGIPVNQWQTCVYSKEEKKTSRVTLSFTDPNKWASAASNDQYKSVPVQVVTESKTSDGFISKEVNTIIEFRPYLLLQEEDYFVPNGVYCPGKISGKELPKLPKTFSFMLQEVQPITASDNKLGTIDTQFEEYDYNNKLFRYTYDKNNYYATEIHDYNTGLNYTFNRKSGNCSISKLTPGGIDSEVTPDGVVIIKNPAEFFNFDKSEYQYVGLRRIDGVNTDIWSGPKTIGGYNAIYEWHFLSDSWNRTDLNAGQITKTPILLKVYLRIPFPNVPDLYLESISSYHIFNFMERSLHLSDYDISLCSAQSSKRFFIFSVENKNEIANAIKSNMDIFKAGIVNFLQRTSGVTILRISNPELTFDVDDDIHVLFTLYEKAPYYGNVPIPDGDVLSEDAIKLFNKTFTSNDKITFGFTSPTDNKSYSAEAIQNSFREIGDYKEGYLEIQALKSSSGTSAGVVAAVTILMTVVGIIISIGLIILHKNKKITIPFLNSLQSNN